MADIKTLRALRKEKQKTLQEVSRELDIALSTLCKYELGSLKVPTDKYYLICDYYGVASFEAKENSYLVLRDIIKNLKNDNSKLKSVIVNLNKRIRQLERENQENEKNIQKAITRAKDIINKL